MMNKNNAAITRWLFVCCLCVTYSLNAIASSNSENIVKQAKNFISKNDYNNAYNLLAPVADYNDDADFNYFYGSVLFKLEKYSLAIFALERALIVRPTHLQTMEALAQTYIEVKEFSKADKLFSQIKEKNPTESSTDTFQDLKNFYVQTKELYKISSFLSSTLGYDSNLTNGPINSYITMPVGSSNPGNWFVGKNLEKDDDFFVTVNGGTNLSIKLADDYGLNGGMYGSHRINNYRSNQDLAFLSGWIGGYYQLDKNRFDLSVRSQSVWLSESDYQDQYSIFGQWSRLLQPNTRLSLYSQISTLDYPNAKTLNADSYLLGTILSHQLNDILWKPLFSAELYGGELRVKSGGDVKEGYENLGGRLTSQLYFDENNKLLIMGTMEHRHYKGENAYFLTTREDKGYSVTGKYSHSLLNKQLELSLQGTWLLNSSTLELYDYKRNLVTLNFQWNF